MTKTFITLFAITLLALGGVAGAQDAAPMDADRAAEQARSVEAQDAESRAQFRSIDQDVQALKKEVLNLNRARETATPGVA